MKRKELQKFITNGFQEIALANKRIQELSAELLLAKQESPTCSGFFQALNNLFCSCQCDNNLEFLISREIEFHKREVVSVLMLIQQELLLSNALMFDWEFRYNICDKVCESLQGLRINGNTRYLCANIIHSINPVQLKEFQERMIGTVKDNFTVKSSKIEALSEDSEERSISNE